MTHIPQIAQHLLNIVSPESWSRKMIYEAKELSRRDLCLRHLVMPRECDWCVEWRDRIQIHMILECGFEVYSVRMKKYIFSGGISRAFGLAARILFNPLSSLSTPPFSRSYVHIFVTFEPESRPHCCIPGLCFSFRSCQIRWFGSYRQPQHFLQLLDPPAKQTITYINLCRSQPQISYLFYPQFMFSYTGKTPVCSE